MHAKGLLIGFVSDEVSKAHFGLFVKLSALKRVSGLTDTN
jgi:hypothetical protein